MNFNQKHNIKIFRLQIKYLLDFIKSSQISHGSLDCFLGVFLFKKDKILYYELIFSIFLWKLLQSYFLKKRINKYQRLIKFESSDPKFFVFSSLLLLFHQEAWVFRARNQRWYIIFFKNWDIFSVEKVPNTHRNQLIAAKYYTIADHPLASI